MTNEKLIENKKESPMLEKQIQKQTLSGWGNFIRVTCNHITMRQSAELNQVTEVGDQVIARGNGRSYGDSALANTVADMTAQDYFIDFHDNSGVLQVQSGVLLADIIASFVPRGWFLQVTPGTKLITVGGAIASDVHGKNHHKLGCFSESVVEFNLMLADGSVVTCSKQDNTELFQATCGGMGLTGIILSAKIQLKKIGSQFIEQRTLKNSNLRETMDAFEKFADYEYSVAWIDCLAKGSELGRSLLTVGEFSRDGNLKYKPKNKLNIPLTLPGFLLNRFTVKCFNWLYFNKVRGKDTRQKVGLDSFFFPLDSIGDWNRIYGKKGFVQYQFILPKNVGFEGFQRILQLIAESGKGSFLAVLKLYGPANDNYLSFPMEGYSLAVDFKAEKGLEILLQQLDRVVTEYRGRIYLAKDSMMSKETFEQGYPNIEQFKAVRAQYSLDKVFNSLQSKRLGI